MTCLAIAMQCVCASGSPLRVDMQCDRQAMCVCVLERIWTPLHIVSKLHWNSYQSGVFLRCELLGKLPPLTVFPSGFHIRIDSLCGKQFGDMFPKCHPPGNIEKH